MDPLKGSILVPMLVRPGLHPDIKASMMAAHERMTKFMDGSLKTVWDDSTFVKAYPDENYWGRFARMRQSVIERYLQPQHDWVLWIDADIIDYPEDLFHQLYIDELSITSPLVSIAGHRTNYDTAGTRPNFEQRSDQQPPSSGDHEMFSVGGCVLVPAEVHRHVSFQAQSDTDITANTEWTSLCVGAAKFGIRIVWRTSVVVHHANLPNYGEQWH